MPPFTLRVARAAGVVAAAVAALSVALFWPDPDPVLPPPDRDARVRPFAWDRDGDWDALEADYARARRAGCDLAATDAALGALDGTIARIVGDPAPAGAPIFAEAERQVFALGPRVAVCSSRLARWTTQLAALRDAVKRQSERWELADRDARETLYRVLYGARAALEEVMLQAPPEHLPPAVVPGVAEPSATPAAAILGIPVHSGDVLLSRGGAATSALIARGNDFAGNFSHVALVHVDARTGVPSVVEAHIERGVAVSTVEAYLADPKLRLLVLRPRADLPTVAADPLLPHRAAEAALADARGRHVPYDFAMDRHDPSRLFCSEVASSAYAHVGVALWMGLSHVSADGLRRWLAAFGVRHFETLEPSDLEYDPQLRVVAEWRAPETLWKDHVDNAVTEAMLDAAIAGAPLRYSRAMLPVARAMKAWSALLNAFGAVGPIPEGMSATAALRNRWYSALHADLVARLQGRADAYRAANGHAPPYWALVRMAKDALRATGALPVPGGRVAAR